MSTQAEIPTDSRRFATRLALFYSALFGLVGTHLPFFPVWLKAVGVDAAWIGIITALVGRGFQVDLVRDPDRWRFQRREIQLLERPNRG